METARRRWMISEFIKGGMRKATDARGARITHSIVRVQVKCCHKGYMECSKFWEPGTHLSNTEQLNFYFTEHTTLHCKEEPVTGIIAVYYENDGNTYIQCLATTEIC
jgi:hypothetical protein